MRTLMAALVLFGASGGARGQDAAPAPSEKQKKLEATKLENCPRLKTYFEKRAGTCPKAAAKAKAVECRTTEDHDQLNALMRQCAREIDATRALEKEAAPEAAPDPNGCRVTDPASGEVIAFASDKSAPKCKKQAKERVLAKRCDGSVKKLEVQYQRRDKPPTKMTLRCPKQTQSQVQAPAAQAR